MADHRGLKRLDGDGAWKEAADEAGGSRFHLQPADPFDLIRWLARTQSDPRKAVAELVQNLGADGAWASLDQYACRNQIVMSALIQIEVSACKWVVASGWRKSYWR